eukprot:10341.XXX_210310_212069_1 [CDS] Oithona nana genome sequencing.
MNYWQEGILKWLGTDLFVHHFLITYLLTNVVFYSLGLFLATFDLQNYSKKQDDENQTKMMIEKYKIQPGTNAPLPLKRFIQLISLVSFNQIIINVLAQYAFYKLHVFLHDLRPQDIQKMPS